jgi:hypothetical protein
LLHNGGRVRVVGEHDDLAGNKQQGHDGRFEGTYRVDVEDVPCLPTFPAAWTRPSTLYGA